MANKQTNWLNLILLFAGILLSSCSDVKQPFEKNSDPEISAHPDGFLSLNSADFHATLIENEDLQREDNEPPAWDACQRCHGDNFEGGISDISCFTCHTGIPHPNEWLTLNSDDFHGLFVRNDDWDWDDCGRCHGADFEGGATTDVSCLACHSTIPHSEGFLDENSEDFHAVAIKESGWQIQDCQSCHGIDYAGATTGSSCLPCHSETPEDCIVCHGGTDNMTGAPPLDLNDNRTVVNRGVGVHSLHLSGGPFSDGIECAECHLVPETFAAAGHVDSDLPAEVIFGSLATLNGAAPIWNTGPLTCADSYCHGNWSLSRAESQEPNAYTADEMTGNSATPKWNDPNSAGCVSCHDLPPTGHFEAVPDDCFLCHGSVVNSNFVIIDKSKHVNGMINVFGQEYPMF